MTRGMRRNKTMDFFGNTGGIGTGRKSERVRYFKLLTTRNPLLTEM
jgi:hypothetical protein